MFHRNTSRSCNTKTQDRDKDTEHRHRFSELKLNTDTENSCLCSVSAFLSPALVLDYALTCLHHPFIDSIMITLSKLFLASCKRLCDSLSHVPYLPGAMIRFRRKHVLVKWVTRHDTTWYPHIISSALCSQLCNTRPFTLTDFRNIWLDTIAFQHW